MNNIWEAVGRLAFWASWPLTFLVLYNSQRSRVLVVCGDEFLVVKGWHSAGDWSLPGGGQHKTEAPQLAAARELREETGLSFPADAYTALGSGRFKQHGLRCNQNLFLVEVAQKPALQLQRREITTASWFNYQQIDQLQLGTDVLTAVHAWRP